MRSVIADILNELDEEILSKKEDIDLDNFKRINAQDYGKSIAFIDGGNAELLKAPNFSLQFVRCCAVVFKNNEKSDIIKNEFFILTSAVKENGISYKSRIFHFKGDFPDEKELNFNCFDATIKQGKEKANISIVGGIARRFAELQLALDVNSDIVVIDGNLKAVYTNEEKYIERLMKMNSVVCGIAKTSDILTSNGTCPIAQLNLIDIDYAWYYPTDKRIFARFNKVSSHVFSIQTNTKEDIEMAVNQIAHNSRDAVFAGYPYGLILADRFARISNNEKEHLSVLFRAVSGEQWKKINKYINAVNAHDVLDSIN